MSKKTRDSSKFLEKIDEINKNIRCLQSITHLEELKLSELSDSIKDLKLIATTHSSLTVYSSFLDFLDEINKKVTFKTTSGEIQAAVKIAKNLRQIIELKLTSNRNKSSESKSLTLPTEEIKRKVIQPRLITVHTKLKPREEAFKFVCDNKDFFAAPFKKGFAGWANTHQDIITEPSERLCAALEIELHNGELIRFLLSEEAGFVSTYGARFKEALIQWDPGKMQRLVNLPKIAEAILRFKTPVQDGKNVIDIWRESYLDKTQVREETVNPPSSHFASNSEVVTEKVLPAQTAPEIQENPLPEAEENLLITLYDQSESLEKRSQNCWQSSDSKDNLTIKHKFLEETSILLAAFCDDRTKENLDTLSKYLEKAEKSQATKTYCLGPFTSSSAFFSPWKEATNTQKVLKKVRDYVDVAQQNFICRDIRFTT